MGMRAALCHLFPTNRENGHSSERTLKLGACLCGGTPRWRSIDAQSTPTITPPNRLVPSPESRLRGSGDLEWGGRRSQVESGRSRHLHHLDRDRGHHLHLKPALASSTTHRPPPAGGVRRTHHGMMEDQALKLLPQPQVLVALGLLNTKPRPMTSSLKSMTVPLRYR